jgi:Putative Ig domain
VAAIVAVFNADYAHTSITPSDGTDLVWSPTDSQTQLLALINRATKTLDVEQEEFSDIGVVNALVSALQRGVTVRVVLESPSDYSSEVTEIENAGGQVTGYSSSTGFYIHAAGKVAILGPGSLSTAAGAAVDYQVQAIDTATGSLSYAATGLPTGLSISSSIGVISGTASTAGTYSVTLTGKDSSGPSGSASFTWTVGSGSGTGTESGCTAAQLLGNPGFETGTAPPWTAASGVIADSSKEPPHSGSWDAWLDGYGTTTTDTLAQTVTLPSGCATDSLSFWLHIDTAETTTTDHRLRHAQGPGAQKLGHGARDAGDVLQPQPRVRLLPVHLQPFALRGPGDHAEVHRCRGQRVSDVVRPRRHRPQRELDRCPGPKPAGLPRSRQRTRIALPTRRPVASPGFPISPMRDRRRSQRSSPSTPSHGEKQEPAALRLDDRCPTARVQFWTQAHR